MAEGLETASAKGQRQTPYSHDIIEADCHDDDREGPMVTGHILRAAEVMACFCSMSFLSSSLG